MTRNLRTRYLAPALAVAWSAAAAFAAPEKTQPDPLAQARQQLDQLLKNPAADKPMESGSIKFIPGPEQTVIQTPCYHLTDPQGRKVELTGAIHIADRAYYEELNDHFKSFDAVLFECVADDDRIKRMQSGAAPAPDEKEPALSKLYRIFAHDLLSMSLQMDVVDYKQPNFIHADMGDTEFNALMASKGVSLDALVTQKQAGMDLSLDQVTNLLPMLKILMPKNDPGALKRMIAPMFLNMENPALESPVARELIVDARNARALEVLDRELAAGKKNVSVFYGSAHLPSMKKTLIDRGWKDGGTEWRTAWTIAPKPVTVKAEAAAPAAPEAPAPADPANDAAAAAVLSRGFDPMSKAKAVKFKTRLSIDADALGQKIHQEVTADVVAMKPNLAVIHTKSAEGKEGVLISDGKTVTTYFPGGSTYKQIEAPANFAGFAKLAGLEELGLDENGLNLFSNLSMEEDASAREDLSGARLLEPATRDGVTYDRVKVGASGIQAICWVSRDAANSFPLSKLEVDTSAMLDQQLKEMGEQAAAMKDLIKLEAGVDFTDGKTLETVPAGTFHFDAPAGVTKE